MDEKIQAEAEHQFLCISSHTPMVLGAYSWLCIWGSLLVELIGPHGMLGVESGSPESKALKPLPAVLLLRLSFSVLLY